MVQKEACLRTSLNDAFHALFHSTDIGQEPFIAHGFVIHSQAIRQQNAMEEYNLQFSFYREQIWH